MTQLIRIAVAQRDELNSAHKEIRLLRAALEERQKATPYARMTPAEIRLRGFDQVRAALGMAKGYEGMGAQYKTNEWRAIAQDFECATARLIGKG
jgi:hypothetical protein